MGVGGVMFKKNSLNIKVKEVHKSFKIFFKKGCGQGYCQKGGGGTVNHHLNSIFCATFKKNQVTKNYINLKNIFKKVLWSGVLL